MDPEDSITVGTLDRLLDAREQQKTQQITDYDKAYLGAYNQLAASVSEAEAAAIVEEMKVLSYDPSNNAAKDAEVNFLKAERAMLRKQLAKPKEKINPVTGKKEHSALGTVTTQKTVTKDAVLPKLDAAGTSYLEFVAREDGADKAQELHKSIGK